MKYYVISYYIILNKFNKPDKISSIIFHPSALCYKKKTNNWFLSTKCKKKQIYVFHAPRNTTKSVVYVLEKTLLSLNGIYESINPQIQIYSKYICLRIRNVHLRLDFKVAFKKKTISLRSTPRKCNKSKLSFLVAYFAFRETKKKYRDLSLGSLAKQTFSFSHQDQPVN